jgi:hypothetical protein
MKAQIALPDSFDLTPAGADRRYRLGKFTDPRSVTQELEALALGTGGRGREIGMIRRDRRRDRGGVACIPAAEIWPQRRRAGQVSPARSGERRVTGIMVSQLREERKR